MGNNVSLTLAQSGTTISSAQYNANLNALNNASSYKFGVGKITAINTFQMAGTGTYTHGIYPYKPVNVQINRADGRLTTNFCWEDGTGGGVGGAPTTTTVFLGATSGDRATVLVLA